MGYMRQGWEEQKAGVGKKDGTSGATHIGAEYTEEQCRWLRFVEAKQRIERRKFPRAVDWLRWAQEFQSAV